MKGDEIITDQIIILLGEPDTGKSTFISRMWASIKYEQSDLIMTNLPDDQSSLRFGLERIQKAKFAKRTPTESENREEIPIEFRRKKSVIIIPDKS